MRLPFLFLTPLVASLLSAGPLPGQYHEDTRVGFKLRTPKDWQQIPLQTNEAWVVGKYVSDERTYYTDPTLGWTYEHKPNLNMIAFVEGADERDLSVEEKEDSFVVYFQSPWKDYKEYMQATYSGGGFYVAEEVEEEVEGVDVTQMEIKVERGAREGPKRIITWVFHLYRVDLAVQFEVLENHFEKQKKHIYRTLNSFKTVERVEALTEAVTGRSALTFDKGSDDMTPEERKEQRQIAERRAHEVATEGLPEDWEVQKYGNITVLNHSTDKHAKAVVDQAEAMLEWLDEEFGYIGPDEYVRSPIIRICADLEEAQRFMSGTSWWQAGTRLEITTYKQGTGMSGPTAMHLLRDQDEHLNREILALWLNEKNSHLVRSMPRWLRIGLVHVIGSARAKGSKLSFSEDQWERNHLRDAGREGKLMTAKDLLMADPSVFGPDLPKRFGMRNQKDIDKQHRNAQAGALVRYLLVGPGSKSRKTKTILHDYLRNLIEVSEAERKARAEAGEDEEEERPKTEEEEEEMYREQRNKWREREIKLMKDTFFRTFADFRDNDWKSFEKGWAKFVG